MMFEFISDIHIKDECPFIIPSAPILILAGDIGHYSHTAWKEFMQYVSKMWKEVIYVLGNHEYYHYGRSYTEIHHHYKLYLSQYPNIHILDSQISSIKINNVRFFGATMWTHLKLKHSAFYRQAISNIKERKYIPKLNEDYHELNARIEDELNHISLVLQEDINTTTLSPETWNMMHEYDTALLYDFVSRENHTNIIITHFPIFKVGSTNPEYEEEDYIKCMFASDAYLFLFKQLFSHIEEFLTIPEYDHQYKLDLEELDISLKTFVFISGHTHYNFTYAFKYENINFIFVSNNQSRENTTIDKISTCSIEF